MPLKHMVRLSQLSQLLHRNRKHQQGLNQQNHKQLNRLTHHLLNILILHIHQRLLGQRLLLNIEHNLLMLLDQPSLLRLDKLLDKLPVEITESERRPAS